MARRHRIPDWSQTLPSTREALAYAERQHAGQRRAADGAPFVVHPLEVACLLYRAGAPDDVIAAGLLHDTIEKTDANAADLQASVYESRRSCSPSARTRGSPATPNARRRSATGSPGPATTRSWSSPPTRSQGSRAEARDRPETRTHHAGVLLLGAPAHALPPLPATPRGALARLPTGHDANGRAREARRWSVTGHRSDRARSRESDPVGSRSQSPG
jgi:HD domain